jgi:hypothetical protein
MNPMIALPFAWHNNAISTDMIIIYCFGPIFGTLIAIALWGLLMVITVS